MFKSPEQSPSSDSNEDNIIHVDFSKGVTEGKQKEIPSLEKNDVIVEFPKDVEAAKKEMKETSEDNWESAYMKATMMMAPYLKTLRGGKAGKAYHDSFASIQKFSDKELVGSVLNSSESDWGVRPSYYKALIEEVVLRDRHSQASAYK